MTTARNDMVQLEAEMIEAGLAAQSTSLDLLLAEMRALAALMPGHELEARSDTEIEADFDNMPV
jgi:hypothetical protein